MSDFIPSASTVKQAESAIRWIIGQMTDDNIDQHIDETNEIVKYYKFIGVLPIRMTDSIRLVYGYEKSIIIDGYVVRPQNLNRYKGEANRWMFLINNIPSLNASQYYDLSHNLSKVITYVPYTKIN